MCWVASAASEPSSASISSAGKIPSWSARQTASAPSSKSPSSSACTTPWAPIWSTTASTTSPCRAQRPLFFLDYLATGRLDPEVTEAVVTGLAEACKANGCALIGGETAQMPGFYADGEYDLAGFIVGAVDRDKMITGAGIKPTDVLIGLPSTGLHTNGYSLARKLLFEVAGYKPTQYVTAIKEKAGAALMKTHRSYLHVIQKLVAAGLTTGMAHITGGGITENLPRILPKGTAAQVELGSWPVLPIFDHLRDLGQVSQEEMMRTFNMGVGLIAAIPAAKFTRAKTLLDRAEEKFYVVGRVVKGERRVQYT